MAGRLWMASYFPACGSYPYVAEALRRRSEAPYLFSRAFNASSSGIFPVTSGNKGKTLNGEWLNGVFWPDFSESSRKYLKVIRDRPAIVEIMGVTGAMK